MVYGASDVGLVRSKNEDSYSIGTLSDSVEYAVVCDGMGGAKGGSVASSMVCKTISEKIEKCFKPGFSDKSIENLLLSAITTANVEVFDKSTTDKDLNGMGTTVVAAVLKNGTACVAHVGDSRAYHINGSGIYQVTTDHSLAQEMFDSGQLTKEEFDNYPHKNIITRAIGVREKVDIDFDYVDLDEGDKLLLCSDGLTNMLGDELILKTLNETPADFQPNKLIEQANAGGGKDNITAVVMTA